MQNSHHHFSFTLMKYAILATLPLLLTACALFSKHSSTNTTTFTASAGCVGNEFLQRYGCSIDRVEQAAQNGDPDAQYALGYMYYYGVGTVRDVGTARRWINKAAAQGQPLAEKASRLLSGGSRVISRRGSGPSMHQTPADVAKLNARIPEKSLAEHLPAYGSSKHKAKRPSVIDALKKKMGPNDHAGKPKAGTAGFDHSTQTPEKPPLHESKLQKHSKSIAALNATERSLLHVRSHSYTLQLIGSYNLNAIKAFVRRHHLSRRAKYYSAQFKGKKWYMLIYGQYPTLVKAHAAVEQLPGSLRALHPWVKSYGDVQKEIRIRKIVS